MFNKIMIVSFITSCSLLTGCSEKSLKAPNYGIWGDKDKKEDQGTQTLVVTHIPNQALVSRDDIARPPNKEQYLKLSPSQKERILTRYSIELLTQLDAANYKLDTLKTWREEMIKLNEKKEK